MNEVDEEDNSDPTTIHQTKDGEDSQINCVRETLEKICNDEWMVVCDDIYSKIYYRHIRSGDIDTKSI